LTQPLPTDDVIIRSTQPCIPLGSLNPVPAIIGWGKGGNVTSTGRELTLCDPVWHVSSRSGEAWLQTTRLRGPTLYFTYRLHVHGYRAAYIARRQITERNAKLDTKGRVPT